MESQRGFVKIFGKSNWGLWEPPIPQSWKAKMQLYFLHLYSAQRMLVRSLEKFDRYLLKFGRYSGLKSDTYLRNLMASLPLQWDQLGVQRWTQSEDICLCWDCPDLLSFESEHSWMFSMDQMWAHWRREPDRRLPENQNWGKWQFREFITHNSQYGPAGEPPKCHEYSHWTVSSLQLPDPESLKLP